MDIKVDQHSVICFDLDDTLYNELEYLKSAYTEIAKNADEKDWLEVYGKMFSLYRSNENAFIYVKETFGIPHVSLLDSYRNHKPQIKPFDRVIELLRTIKEKNGIVAVITDGRSITQRNKLKALGIMKYLDEIVISEELGAEKPSEKNYLAIEQAFPDKSYTYIADNFKKDFIVPNKRGWNSIGVLDNGLNIHNNTFEYIDNKSYCPCFLVKSLEEINIT